MFIIYIIGKLLSSPPLGIPRRILCLMPDTISSFALGTFKDVADRFAKDLEALDHEDLIRPYGDGTRCAYDFVYEVAIVNRRQAVKLRGEDPGPLPWDFGKDWLKAPDELCDKTPALTFFQDCAQEVISQGEKMADAPNPEDGSPSKLLDSLVFLSGHMMYHDGQLNFIQAAKGDMALHW